jgi:hypothetical protein
VKEIDDATKWYFRRNKYESLMVRVADLGEDKEDDSETDSDSATSGSKRSESDYEAFRHKKKLREKKKLERKKKAASKKSGDRDIRRFNGNEEEIATLIWKLNTMNLNDPEYAPIYYKVMVMDRSGTAGKCVKPPIVDSGEPIRMRPRAEQEDPRWKGH